MKRLLLVLAIICFKNGLYAIGKVDPNEQFLQDVINEQYGRVIASLKNRSVDINTVDKFGQTALILAVLGQDEEMVRILLDYLPDINKKDFNNKTALDYAKELRNDEFDVVDLLKRYKKTSAPAATQLHAIELKNSELKKAIQEKNIPMLDILLDYYAKEHNLYPEEESKKEQEIAIEPDPKKQMTLRRKLNQLIASQNEAAIRELLKAGADVNFILTEDRIQCTPLLEVFGLTQNMKIFQLLLDSGANPNIGSLHYIVDSKIVKEPRDYQWRQAVIEALNIYDEKQKAKELLEQIKLIKIDEIRKALDLANWPKDVANIVCEY